MLQAISFGLDRNYKIFVTADLSSGETHPTLVTYAT